MCPKFFCNKDDSAYINFQQQKIYIQPVSNLMNTSERAVIF